MKNLLKLARASEVSEELYKVYKMDDEDADI